MKIRITHKPDSYSALVSEYDKENYIVEAELESPEDANAVDVIKMFVKAMQIEGYADKSIYQCMLDVALYEAFESNLNLEIDAYDYESLKIREEDE